MHPLISQDVTRFLMEDRLREAETGQIMHELRDRHRSRGALRSALGLRLVALGTSLARASDDGLTRDSAARLVPPVGPRS